MKDFIFKNWERQLDWQFLSINCNRKIAYICSPLRAEDEDSVMKNIRAAKAYMFYAVKEMGLTARAPHAYLPMLLCDQIPAERELALNIGIKILEMSDLMLVCGNKLSSGMWGEIMRAVSLGLEIRIFDSTLYNEISERVINITNSPRKIYLDRVNELLGFPFSKILSYCRKENRDDMPV